jgi:multisubunit Na+/H+ antiporter MnhE subunit
MRKTFMDSLFDHAELLLGFVSGLLIAGAMFPSVGAGDNWLEIIPGVLLFILGFRHREVRILRERINDNNKKLEG